GTRRILVRIPHVRATGGRGRELPALALPPHEDRGTHHWPPPRHGRLFGRGFPEEGAGSGILPRAAGRTHGAGALTWRALPPGAWRGDRPRPPARRFRPEAW